ncbi:site-2 protease family protein [Streptomyces sp. KLOTTS4A1]|uniref:site-2 protease family protein n=1 Tax=Streptomyces sp. KLOTTS4A1 TaxID=3390996 RepID=UPI0039F4B9F1
MDESGASGLPRSGGGDRGPAAGRAVPPQPPHPDAPAHDETAEPRGTDSSVRAERSVREESSARDAEASEQGSKTPDRSGDGSGAAAETPDPTTSAGPAAAGEPATDEQPAATAEPATTEPAPTEPSPTEPAPTEPAAPEEPATTTAPHEQPPQPAPVRALAQHPRTPAPGGAKGAGGAGEQGKKPGGGLLMGRIFGVPIYVAPSWFLVAALITWVFGGQLDRVLPELGAARYLVSLFFAVAFYASVLVHELAHTVAALRFKLPVRKIQLQFFGGVSEIEKESETPGREFILAFVGPLLSLVLAGVFYAGMQTVEAGTVPGVLLAGLMISNLIVAAFNLLPGLPLDGGRMLRAVVWKITGKPMSGTVAAAWVGRALAISVLIGLPLLTQSGALGAEATDSVGMDTVTDALLAAILAAIIWTGAGNSLRMARLRERLPELRARTLTRRAVPVEPATPLSEALRRANDAGARALVVVDGHGEPVAVVREAAIVGVPEHRRPWVAVSGLAQDLTDGMTVSAELAGEELIDTLRATPATEYLVVEDTGQIYGVLSTSDVERAFVKAMDRSR